MGDVVPSGCSCQTSVVDAAVKEETTQTSFILDCHIHQHFGIENRTCCIGVALERADVLS